LSLLLCIVLFAVTIASPSQAADVQLKKRTPCPIPLAKLSLAFEENSTVLKRVRVIYEGSTDQIVITPFNDEFVKHTRMGRETTVHREPWQTAWIISEFEGEHLFEVTETLIEMLEILERELKRNRFDKCLYIDSYLPRFLRGYYYLCDAVTNHNEPLPHVTRVPESAYDVSLQSPKSDKRVGLWQEKSQHVMKLRITTKELAYQLEEWVKTEKRRKNNQDILFFNNNLRKAYSLFIRIYFNLPPPPKLRP